MRSTYRHVAALVVTCIALVAASSAQAHRGGWTVYPRLAEQIVRYGSPPNVTYLRCAGAKRWFHHRSGGHNWYTHVICVTALRGRREPICFVFYPTGRASWVPTFFQCPRA